MLVMAHIYKHSQNIKLSYVKQRHEHEISSLKHKKEDLLQKIYALKNPSTIKKRVQEELGMQELSSNNLKKIPS